MDADPNLEPHAGETRMYHEQRQLTPAMRKQRQLAAVKTGFYVKAPNGKVFRDRRVRRLVRKMQVAMPWLDDADLAATRGWAELEILGAYAFAHLIQQGVTNEAGEPRRLLNDYRMIRQTQLAYAKALGMTPESRMGLRVGDSKARAYNAAASHDATDVEALEAQLMASLGGSADSDPCGAPAAPPARIIDAEVTHD